MYPSSKNTCYLNILTCCKRVGPDPLMNYAYMMIVDSKARTAHKISAGLRKYREGIDHRKEVALEEGCKLVPDHLSMALY